MTRLTIPKNLETDINQYCKVNNITDIDNYVVDMLQRGHNIEKYGNSPNNTVTEKVVEKIVEKIIEVPVSSDNPELTNKINDLISENNHLRDTISELNKIIDNLKNKKDLYGE
jgi:predicted RNase H-like nuclease (RuvC/YqgF family)